MIEFFNQILQYLTYSLPGAPPCHLVFDDNIKYIMYQQSIDDCNRYYDSWLLNDILMMNDPFASLFMPPHIVDLIENILELQNFRDNMTYYNF